MTGKDLKDWRKRWGYSQHNLARALGVTLSTVASWEQDNRSHVEPRSWLAMALRGIERVYGTYHRGQFDHQYEFTDDMDDTLDGPVGVPDVPGIH